MSREQFQQLLATVASGSKHSGSMVRCPVKFNGNKSASEVESFLAAVRVFKKVEHIEDEDVLTGMPLILTNDAATWWQGIKNQVKTWSQFEERLRHAFAPKKLAFIVYQEIVERKQKKDTLTEIFVAEKRALLADLPAPGHTEQQEIDLVFGQIRFEIREKLSREAIESFDDLLGKAREIERNLGERAEEKQTFKVVESTPKGKTRCNYCRLPGHTSDVCRKRQKAEQQKPAVKPVETKPDDKVKPKFSCYGCGEPGVVRSRCPKCNVQRVGTEEVNFCSINTASTICLRPIVPISIGDIKGTGFVDTCARSSVASYQLFVCLKQEGYDFNKETMNITLADGIPKIQTVLTVTAPVNIYGKVINTSFIVMPHAKSNKTLLGVGFIEDAMMVLNLPQLTFRFLDDPVKVYDLKQENICETMIADLISIACLPEIVSPMSTSPEKVITPKSITSSLVEQNLIRPYGPVMTVSSPDVLENAFVQSQREPLVGNEAPTNMEICQASARPQTPTYGPLVPIEFSTPPSKRQRLFDGHSPVVDALYQDARRSLEESVIELSPDSRSLFNSPSTDISSIDAEKFDCVLSNDDFVRLQNLLEKNANTFVPNGKPTCQTEHFIDTGDHRPISVPPYRLSPAKTQILKDEVSKMLAEGIIEPCNSPWSAPVVMVPKKDGGTRVCIDYRQLNAVTIPDVYPLPRIDDLLHDAKPTPYMSTIDLRAGYWQIRVKQEDQCKTAFVTPFGMYKFLRMPFGLRNAPATFQRLMDGFRVSLSHVKLYVYIDDLIVLSPTFEQHLSDLRDVFSRLQEYNLTANKEKCKFCCSRVKYLGHYITPKGLEMDPNKVSAIVNMTAPTNVKHLLSFLQMCSWYRRFIPGFAKVAEPLTRLTKKQAKWLWEDEQEGAYNKLKELLTTSPILVQADDSNPYIIKTDASNYAIGAVLVQGEGEQEHPVEYASRLLNQAERNYSTTEREALAVVWALNKFRGYIEGTPITILTDHQALKWLMSLKSPTGRLARWALQLQPYDITVKYITGKTNVVADALSRPNCDTDTKENCGICSIVIDTPRKNPKEIREAQMKDENIEKIVKAFESNNEEESRYWCQKGYVMNNGLLYRYNPDGDSDNSQLLVPELEQINVISAYHDEPTAGHYGTEKTFARIAQRYYWKGMRKDIENYVRNCLSCQRYKPSNMKPAGLLQTTAMNKRFEVVAFDLFGPLPASTNGMTWILIIEDLASRWIELFPLEHATATNCAMTLINEIFLRYGMPRRIISDNGTQFVSAVMQQVAYCLDIKHAFTPVYHPETNSVERRNRDLKTQLAILVGDDHRTWSEKLPSIRFAMNTAVCSSTEHTPAYLTFGRELRTPDDNAHDLREIISSENFIPEITPKLLVLAETLKRVREVQEGKEEKRKEYVDKSRRPSPKYKPGDRVLVDAHTLSKTVQGFSSKLAPRRDGPYIILKNHGPSSYHVADPKTPNQSVGLYHSSALRPFQSDTKSPLPAPARPIRKRGRPPKTADPLTTVEVTTTKLPKPTRGRPRKDTASLPSSSRRLRSQRGRL